VNDLRQGDIVLVRTNHFVSKLIRFGQRSYGKEFSQWNHVAIVVATPEDPKIVEALTKGITESPLSKYPAEDIKIVHAMPRGLTLINTFDMRYNAALFAASCKGESYGFMTILAIALKTLFKGRFNFGVQGTSICSGLAARSLERMGYNFQPYDPAELTPAYLAKNLS
jgi:hypothetical protein